MATLSRAPRARKPQLMRLLFCTRNDSYIVSPAPVDPGVGRAGFRLNKLTGDRATYYVLQAHEAWHCECLGFLRWGTPCKHIRMVQAAQAVFAGQCPPAEGVAHA